MRARTFYGGLMVPVVAWQAATALAKVWTQSLDAEILPGSAGAVVVAACMWSYRLTPFVMVGLALLTPVLYVAAAYLIGRGSNRTQSMREAIPWATLWLASWGTAFAIAIILTSPPISLVILVWSGALAECIIVAHAYHAQRRLQAQGVSRVGAGGLLATAVLLSVIAFFAGVLVATLPAWLEWRLEARGRPTKG
jgi:hypothetical protein